MHPHTQNGTAHAESHLLDDQLDTIKDEVSRLFDRVKRGVGRRKSGWRGLTRQLRDVIEAHPIAAVGAALGLGYLAVRIARR